MNNKSNKGKKLHRYDILTETCKRCGIKYRNIPLLLDRYHLNMGIRFKKEFSTDNGKTWVEGIECK